MIVYFRNKVSGKLIEADEKWADVYRTQPDLEEVQNHLQNKSNEEISDTPPPARRRKR